MKPDMQVSTERSRLVNVLNHLSNKVDEHIEDHNATSLWSRVSLKARRACRYALFLFLFHMLLNRTNVLHRCTGVSSKPFQVGKSFLYCSLDCLASQFGTKIITENNLMNANKYCILHVIML